MNNTTHLCKIPCNSLPLIGEADFGLTLKPVIHMDRTASFHVLIYILKGSMEVIEDGVAYNLTPGTLFFLKKGVHHWGEKAFQSGTAWYYVHFYSHEPDMNMKPLESKPIFGEHSFLTPEAYQCYITIPKLLKMTPGNEIEKKIENLINIYKSADLIRMNMALWEVLLQCAEYGHDENEVVKENSRTKKIVDFLERNYYRNFTSEELENEIGLTYKYAGTLFKTKTGMTIKEYQLMLRIRRAVKLLCETKLSITEIASETGFYDAFYFSKMFKRAKEISPQKFRDTYVPRI